MRITNCSDKKADYEKNYFVYYAANIFEQLPIISINHIHLFQNMEYVCKII